MEMNRIATWGLALLVGIVCASLPAAAADFSAGAAKAAITPHEPAYLAGYDSNRLSEVVQSDIWVRALVIKSGEKTLSLAVVDLIGFPNLLQRQVRGLVKAVPADSVIIAATHSHSAPDPIGLWGPEEGKSGVNKPWLEATLKTIAATIDQAAQNAKPAKLKLAAIETKGIARNIRVPRIVDPELAVMQFVDAEGKAIATLANIACHAEIMQNKMLSADFPHYYYQKIEKDLGGIALFVNGAEGGMVTADIDDLYKKEGQDNSALAEKIGLLVADFTENALKEAKTVESPALDYKVADLLVPLESDRYRAAIQAGLLPNTLQDGKLRTQVAVIALGPAQIVTIPGEALPNLGFRLKRSMTGSPKFIFGLTFDELGYIMSADDWGLQLYDYESRTGMGPDTGPTLISALLPLIAEVKPAAPAAAAGGTGQVAAWFAGLTSKFKPDRAEGITATYHFKISGDGGGDWTVAIADKKCKVENKAPDKADLAVAISAQDWMDLVGGKLDAMAAFSSGRLVLDGDMGLAMQIPTLFFD